MPSRRYRRRMRRRRRGMRRRYRRVMRRSRRGSFAKRVRTVMARATEQKVASASLLANYPSIGTTWLEYDFQDVAQGTTSMQRIGDRIKMKTLKIYGTVMGGQAAGVMEDVYNIFRIVVAVWRPEAGTTPLGTLGCNMDDPLNPRDPAGFTGMDPQDLKNKMVTKLYDKKFFLVSRGLARYDANQYIPAIKKIFFKKVWPGLGLEVKFGDTGLGFPNKRVIISMISDSAGIPHPGFVDGWISARFCDL